LPVYLPTLLFAIGQGAVVPIVAVAARDLGASLAFAGFIVALRGIGVLIFDVPAGWLVARFGEKLAMTVATGLVVISLLGSALAPSPWVFAAATLLMGCGWSVWLLARLTYVSEVMPAHLRGRALSTLGGVNRVGMFIGPFIGAGVALGVGLDGAYYVHIVTAIAAAACLVWLVTEASDGREARGHEHVNFTKIVRENTNVFLTAGVGVTGISTLRAARQSLLPLWATAIGLDAAEISLIFGISMGMDMMMFYPAGTVMDRWGRKAVAIPCLTIMSIGMLLLPLTGGFWSMTAVGLLIGFGNGLGSGIAMTLGADFSPPIGRAQFLGAWRLCGDIGTAGGPVLAAGIIGVATLGAAPVAMGVIGLGGAVLMFARMPETLPSRRPRAGPSPGVSPGGG
jgi:MFS family permease